MWSPGLRPRPEAVVRDLHSSPEVQSHGHGPWLTGTAALCRRGPRGAAPTHAPPRSPTAPGWGPQREPGMWLSAAPSALGSKEKGEQQRVRDAGDPAPGRGLGAQRGFRGRPACASCHVSSRVNRHCGSVAALPTGWPVGGFSRLAYLSSIWKRSVLKPTELRPRVPEPPRHPRQTDLWGRPRTEAPPAGPLLPNLSFPGSG